MKSETVDLSVSIAGLKLKNPFLTASGTCGYGSEIADFYAPDHLGALVSKGITWNKQDGNPQPRVCETASGMINRIGLENPGIKVFVQQILPKMAEYKIPVIVNINGFEIGEYGALTKVLDKEKAVSAIEVNLGCPNVHNNRLPFGSTPEMVTKVVHEVRNATDKLLIVKLTPNVMDIGSIALAAVRKAGADNCAISLVNTFLAAFIQDDKPFIGGLSGPAIKPMALLKILQVAEAFHRLCEEAPPIIGMGGISTVQDVIDFIKAGATAVAVGTATFKNPLLIPQLQNELQEYCQNNGITSIEQIYGTVRLFNG